MGPGSVETLAGGPPVSWRSESSPALVSPQQVWGLAVLSLLLAYRMRLCVRELVTRLHALAQVSYLGGSCTGTAVMLAAVAR